MSASVGERLRSVREQKRITLEEAIRATKIQRNVLEAIEAGRAQEILSPAYARIFVKKYAGFLGLDGLSIVEEYLTGQPEAATSSLNVEAELARRSEGPGWRQWVPPAAAMLAGMIGVAFLIYLTWDLWGMLRRARSVPAPAAAASAEARPRGQEPIIPVSQSLKLTVRATDKVWFQLKSDGSVIFQGVLSKGAEESWTARKDLEIWTGNASAMQLLLNGKPLEGLGRGVRKGIRVTHAGIEER